MTGSYLQLGQVEKKNKLYILYIVDVTVDSTDQLGLIKIQQHLMDFQRQALGVQWTNVLLSNVIYDPSTLYFAPWWMAYLTLTNSFHLSAPRDERELR